MPTTIILSILVGAIVGYVVGEWRGRKNLASPVAALASVAAAAVFALAHQKATPNVYWLGMVGVVALIAAGITAVVATIVAGITAVQRPCACARDTDAKQRASGEQPAKPEPEPN